MALDEARKKGPTLVVDAGNALFKAPGLTDAVATARAEFILGAMGKLGTFAMAIGERDLNLGPGFLKANATKANVKLLSANLLDAEGKLLFPASEVIQVGGVKVALIGVTRPGPVQGSPGVKAGPVVPSVVEEAKRLRGKVELVVVLAAVPYADALQLAGEAKEAVDFVIHSHDSRGPMPAQRTDWNFTLSGGERGRQLGKLELVLSGRGPFVDLEEVAREKSMVEMLDRQIDTVKKRLAATQDKAARKDLSASLESLKASRASHQKAARASAPKRGRTLRLEWLALGPEIKDDPALKALVERIEPPGSAAH